MWIYSIIVSSSLPLIHRFFKIFSIEYPDTLSLFSSVGLEMTDDHLRDHNHFILVSGVAPPPWWPLLRHIASSLSDGRPSLWAKRRKDRHNERIKSTPRIPTVTIIHFEGAATSLRFRSNSFVFLISFSLNLHHIVVWHHPEGKESIIDWQPISMDRLFFWKISHDLYFRSTLHFTIMQAKRFDYLFCTKEKH